MWTTQHDVISYIDLLVEEHERFAKRTSHTDYITKHRDETLEELQQIIDEAKDAKRRLGEKVA